MRPRRRPVPPTLPPQPDCQAVAAVLQSYLDGELAEHTTSQVAAHLEHCARCEVEAALVARVIAMIRRQRTALDPAVLERLTGAVEGFVTPGDTR